MNINIETTKVICIELTEDETKLLMSYLEATHVQSKPFLEDFAESLYCNLEGLLEEYK